MTGITEDLSTQASVAPRLSMRDISLRFGSTLALDGVSLDVRPGEIVGLLGHNGAGKSTLLNVATGVYEAHAGQLHVDGEAVPPGSSPRDFAGRGVTVIHQEPALVPNLDVLDNLFLARRAPSRRADRIHSARTALDEVGGSRIRLEAMVAALSLGERQLVDLARGLLAGEMRVLLLDEPTAALGHEETEALHTLIRSLAAKGVGVVYVSHRLPDIVSVCTRIVVLRGGALVMNAPTAGMSIAQLSEALAPPEQISKEWHAHPGEVRATVRIGDELLRFRDGEIVGLFGMAAGDQFRMLGSLFGMLDEDFAATVDDRPHKPRTPAHAIRAGVYMVQPDRDSDGLIGALSGVDNVFLPWYDKAPWNKRSQVRQKYDAIRETLQIQGPSGDTPIPSFSGGNRQKHLIARWTIPSRPRLLLLSQPTQGVDIQAKRDIRELLRQLADSGVCVLIASAEADEIASICSRTVVLSHGRCKMLEDDDRLESRMLSTLLQLSEKQGANA